jgi:hypothetical protein
MGPEPVTSRGYPNQYAQGFPSNNSIMLPYASKLSIDPLERKYDMGMQELMFVRTSEPNLRTLPYPEYQFRNISRLNTHLMTPECRKKYGASTSADDLLKDWQLFASQQRDPYDYGSGPTPGSGIMLEQVTTMIVGQRARMWNIWAASGAKVRPGNHLWIIPIRREYKSPIKEALKDISSRSGIISFGEDDRKGQVEHYWRLEPYVTTSAAPPPICLYSNEKFQSRPLFVGIVVEMYGDMADEDNRYYGRALKAIFPDASNDEYRKHLIALNEVVVFLGTR